MIDGWCITVGPCDSLSQEQQDFISWKLSILADSTRGIFDDPVLVIDHFLQAFYTADYRAQETCEHILAYLQTIKQDLLVEVTLRSAQWKRDQKDQWSCSL